MTNRDTAKKSNSKQFSVETPLPFVSVIVPVYTDVQHLSRLVDAIKTQSYPKDSRELLIVDNGTGQSLTKFLSGMENAQILYESIPSSYAARNRGILAATGSILAFTDVDCIPDEQWLMKGVQALQSDPNIGFVGGHIEVFAAKPEHPTFVELFEMLEDFNQERFVKKWAFAATANMFTRKEVMEKIGVFKTNLKSSGDHDWGIRVVKAGYRGIWSPSAIVRHPARRTFQEFFRKTARVQGGQYDIHLKQSGEAGGWSMLTKLWRKDWPNGKDFRNLCRNSGYSGSIKMKLFFMFLLYKVVRSFELIRLLAGGRSKRS